MLQSILGYTRSIGIDTRWMVIGGNPEFYRVTKRLHHALHGSWGDGSALDAEARAVYEQTLASNAIELASIVRPRDVVILHDPQTAGLGPALIRHGAHVVWRCHVGLDHVNAEAEAGWAFLEPYLAEIRHFVFSRRTYVPPICDHDEAIVIQPSIDAFSAKNQDLPGAAVTTTARPALRYRRCCSSSSPPARRSGGTAPRAETRAHGPGAEAELKRLGIPARDLGWLVTTSRGPWRLSRNPQVHSGFSARFFAALGLFQLPPAWRTFASTR